MARRNNAEQEAAGSDSFLDVITNIVGILIILVMVVGERAKRAPVEIPPPQPSAELAAARGAEAALDGEVRRTAAQLESVQAELVVRAAGRGQLATLAEAIERDLAARRAALDRQSQNRYDLDRALAAVADESAQLEAQRAEVEQAAAPQTVEVESYPTPLGRTVDGREVHFQLIGGRLAYLPYESLMDRLQGVWHEAAAELQNQAEYVGTLGPIEGFRLQYLIQRIDTPQGTLLQVAYIEFVPVSPTLGEQLDEALAAESKFRQTLRLMSPRDYTVTVWTYPDSFAEYRRLKKELYGLGYAVAARPLPHGAPIGASPQGSKSAAQ
jgi:hypothetical protein